MTSFQAGFLENHPLSQSLLQSIRLIGEYKGRQVMFQQQSPQMLQTLQEVAVIQSAESSNRLEGITTAPKRLQQLLTYKVRPQSRSEQEIAGYRDVLKTIHASAPYMPLSAGLVQQLHRDLLQFSPAQGGNWKQSDNTIRQTLADGTEVVRFEPVSAFQTPEAMAQLHERFGQQLGSQAVEPLLLAATYILDFLSIHPFSDGNGRMARLLTLLLLYQMGYEVGRYISLEQLIEQTRESYYDALYLSSQGWHEGEHSLLPWWEYFVGIVLAAYGQFEERVGLIGLSPGGKKAQVMATVERLPEQFQVADVERVCAGVSRATISRALRELREQGRIECVRGGRDALWKKRGG